MTQQPPKPPRIDLRSDTFTQPSPTMREAMFRAEVGDDVFSEDPTINQLEMMAAQRMHKDAALFVSSGTQGNLVALLAHCGRGDEAIMGDAAHSFIYEQGGAAALGGIHSRTVPTQRDGTLNLDDIRVAIRSDDQHFPISKLVILENTHNRAGGTYLTPAYTDAVSDLAHEHGLKLHIDGARIFNAAVAQGVDVASLAEPADSVTFCLSKGLSAPVGSLLCGTEDFIRVARRARKVLGGGMRQAGVLAAAGIVALNEMVERLADDHTHCRLLAEGIAPLPGITIDMELVQTNILYFNFHHPALSTLALVDMLRQREIGVLAIGPARIRAVTHYGIERSHIEEAIDLFQDILT